MPIPGVSLMHSGKKTSRMAENALMVFFKYPELGQVKTRLAKDVGEAKALEIDNTLFLYTSYNVKAYLNDAKSLEVRFFFSSLGPVDTADLNKLGDFVYIRQAEGDLGQRFEDGFDKMFKDGPRKVVVIGIDCIGLTKDVLAKAFAALDENDVVIGPTDDCGYYLIGFKEPRLAKELLRDIPWSTDRVFERTMERINGRRLKAQVLQQLYDVDTVTDWDRAFKEHSFLRILHKQCSRGQGGA